MEEEYLPVDTARQEEKSNAEKIMEEQSDRLHEKQKHGRRHTSLEFWNGQTALSCIDPNNNNQIKIRQFFETLFLNTI